MRGPIKSCLPEYDQIEAESTDDVTVSSGSLRTASRPPLATASGILRYAVFSSPVGVVRGVRRRPRLKDLEQLIDAILSSDATERDRRGATEHERD